MKLSVLLITGSSDRVALDTVESIISRAEELVKDTFLIIAGDFTEDDRKKLYLERAAGFGMTAFINIGGKSDTDLLNTFVKHANAEYCTVMRAGSKCSPAYFAKLTAALDEYSDINIACGRITGGNEDCFMPAAAAGIIQLEKKFDTFPATFEGVIVRTSFAAAHPFEAEAGGYTELKCLLAMLSESGRFFYDSSLTVRTAEERDSEPAIDDHISLYENCLLPLTEKCKGRDGRLPMFMQHFYTKKALICARQGQNTEYIPDEDRKHLLDTMKKLLKHIEDKVLCDVYGIFAKAGGITLDEKLILLGIKHGREDFLPDISYNNERLYAVQRDIVLFDSSRFSIDICGLNAEKGSVVIDGCFQRIFSERRTKIVAVYGGQEYTPEYDGKGEPQIFFGKKRETSRTFRLVLPVSQERAELGFYILFKGCRYELRASYSARGARLIEGENFYPVGSGIFAVIEGGRLTTAPMDEKEQRWRRADMLKGTSMWEMSFGMRTAYKLSYSWFAKRNIWLFADDTEAGGGAAEDMFRYAMTRHDELYCYYLTDKNSPAAERLSADGYKPLYRGTLLHRLIYLNAQVYITTQTGVNDTNLPDGLSEDFAPDRVSRRRVVFLQSTPEDKPDPVKNARLYDNVRLYFCGTAEYMQELEKPCYGYKGTEVLQLTGLTGYDDIKDTSDGEKLMVLFSRYIPQEGGVFAESEVCGCLKSLLENEGLKTALADSGYTLTIAIEGVTADEASALPETENVTVLNCGYDTDELKSRASLIVTNDSNERAAGIMRKPLIWFGCEGGTYGETADTPETLAEMMCKYIAEGMTLSEEQSKKADEQFGKAPLGTKREIYNRIITYLYENGEIDGYEDFEVADGYEDEE
ncbi:hypothetical protein [uncultured Ruminococcus sp.]|uniref:hypothetical protein n=1 Tax=uncultured Ruminococcus sp. TaxID=165186 RepID=UPI0025CED6EF|nr:hypothetical protein [uncultured Ruminococcus sp.]